MRPVRGLSTLSSTVVPEGPLIIAVATSAGSPAIDLPSTARITSPSRITAFSAGVSSNTVVTVRPCFTSRTLSPMPEKLPDVSSSNRLSCPGLK